MTISINNGMDAVQHVHNPTHEPMETMSGIEKRTEPEIRQDGTKAEEIPEYSIEAETLTKTDIEIRKLHALRRAKEYIEVQIANAVQEQEDIITEPVLGSPAEREYKARAPLALPGVGVSVHSEAEENAGGDASYKTGAAIKGYKTYKKETPKAWEEPDVDEKR